MRAGTNTIFTLSATSPSEDSKYRFKEWGVLKDLGVKDDRKNK